MWFLYKKIVKSVELAIAPNDLEFCMNSRKNVG